MHLNREGQITERFTRAVDQLGNKDALDVRLGGIYALERIARDSAADEDAIIEILSAYVHGHAPLAIHRTISTSPRGSDQPESTLVDQPTANVPLAPDPRAVANPGRRQKMPSLQTRAADVQAAVTVLTRRRVDARPADLPLVDLRRANLQSADLRRANLENADLQEADSQTARLQCTDLRAPTCRAPTSETPICCVPM